MSLDNNQIFIGFNELPYFLNTYINLVILSLVNQYFFSASINSLERNIIGSTDILGGYLLVILVPNLIQKTITLKPHSFNASRLIYKTRLGSKYNKINGFNKAFYSALKDSDSRGIGSLSLAFDEQALRGLPFDSTSLSIRVFKFQSSSTNQAQNKIY